MMNDVDVLLVDDERSFLELTKIYLEKEGGLNVITSPSAREGLKILDERDIDVIVSDYQMPGMDGLGFLEEVKKNREMQIPFIIFTEKGREEIAGEALNLGAERYIQKCGDPSVQYSSLVM